MEPIHKGQTQRLTLYIDPDLYVWLATAMKHGRFISLSRCTGYLLEALRRSCEATGEGPIGWSSAIYKRSFDGLEASEGPEEHFGDNIIDFPPKPSDPLGA